jgi:hypothetical protein
MPITYLEGGELATAERTNELLNELVASLDTKMETILGGRSPIVAVKSSAGVLTWPVFGKCFFFTSGRTTYSKHFPGYIETTVNVNDPVTGVPTAVAQARPYDHTPFTNAVAAAVVSSYDGTYHVATVPAFGGAYYTNGLAAVAGVSLLDHSLEAHTVVDGGQTYFVKEADRPVPEKRYKYALAEIILEGQTAVVLPASYDKFSCFRIHNLNAVSATVDFAGVYTVSLEPFECKSIRRDTPTTNYRAGYRYFQKWEGGDPRFFWYTAGLPSNGGATTVEDTTVRTATAGMQGNNLVNPAVVYDWIQFFTTADLWASFVIDPHEVCDMSTRYAEKFGDPTNAATLFGDLIHHKGTMVVVKIAAATDDPIAGAPTKLGVFTPVEFTGYANLSTVLGAQGITVGTDAGGNVKLTEADADWSYDLIGIGTNLLKNYTMQQAPTDAELYTSFVQSGVVISAGGGVVIGETRVFESGATAQDANGQATFTLQTQSTYRIRQRSLASVANTKQYTEHDADVVTVTGPNTETLSEAAAVTAKVMAAFHTVTVAGITDLSYFGNPALGSQDDSYVSYTGAALKFTPEGLVLTFTERVVVGKLPSLSTSYYTNHSGREFALNGAGTHWELKHCVRFRGHGFGWGQHGKKNAGYFTPFWSRAAVVGLTREVMGDAGADFGFPPQCALPTGVRMLRRISRQYDMRAPSAGGRFFLCGNGRNMDGVCQFALNYSSRIAGVYPWYHWQPMAGLSNRTKITSVSEDVQRTATDAPGVLMMPLCIEHYNGMAQAINQLKTGRALNWRALRVVWGSRLQDFSALTLWNAWSVSNGWYGFGDQGAPAPLNALCRVDNGLRLPAGGGSYTYPNSGWKDFFDEELVAIQEEADLPASVATYAAVQSEKRDVQSNATLEVSGAAWGGLKNIYEPDFADTYYWRTIGATVTLTLDAFAFGNLVQTSAGACQVASPRRAGAVDSVGYAGQSSTLSAYGTNFGSGWLSLASCYDNIEWVTIEDFQGLVESYGFNFQEVAAIYPLKLDTFEAPTTMEAGVPTQDASVDYVGEVVSMDTNRSTALSAPTTSSVASSLTVVDNLSASALVTLKSNLVTKMVVFRMEETAPEFKTPVLLEDANDPIRNGWTVFERADRTEGRERIQTARAIGGRILVTSYSHGAGNSTTLNSASAEILDSFDIADPVQFGTASPWLPADFIGAFPASEYPNPEADPYPPLTDAIGAVFVMQAGPNRFMELQAASGGAVEKFENYLRWLKHESVWFAVQISASTGLDPEVPVYMAPKSQWGRTEDWWRGSSNEWLGAAFGPSTEPWRSISAPGAGDTITAGVGVTAIRAGTDEAYRVFFNLDGLTVEV